MSDENEELLIGYFPDVASAEAAAHDLKEWDKGFAAIKLGAMGIVTMDEDGEIKTSKIGARAAGTGAKWGVLAGVVAGILTGGVGLIGGAVAGLVVGSAAGALFHHGLGMSDEEKENLEQHLKAGGAALAVLAQKEEAAATVSVLSSLCDEVTQCRMDTEFLDQVRDSNADAEE